MFIRLGLIVCSFLFAIASFAGEPSVLYLSWIHDPLTTMTIQWHTDNKEMETEVLYRVLGEEKWLKQEGLPLCVERSKLVVHTVELNGLEPGTDYQFQIVGHNQIYRFRTLPQNLGTPLRFVVGGDAYYYINLFRKMNAQIAAVDPDFVVVGGDIAYTNGVRAYFKSREWEIGRWQTFLREWKSQLVTSDGRLIPLVVVVGNHDVRGSSLNKKSQNPLFYDLFAMPEKNVPFRTMDCGNYLSLFLLDTGHSYHISGQQTEWLKQKLAKRENRFYKFAVYHISAYPSAYSYEGSVPTSVRENWVPLFEQYDLNMAFENHNHTYKRTFPLKEGKINPSGVVYIGDGSWGVSTRKTHDHWYLEKRNSMNAVCVVTLSKDGAVVEALNNEGKIFDSVKTFPTVSQTAWCEHLLLR